MISDALQKWTFVIFIFIGAVHSQMPMGMPYPMGGYGPIMMPGPPPMPIPMPVLIRYPESTTTTTTTTEISPEGDGAGDNNRNGGIRIPIAIPMPIPNFVQIAIPGFECQNGNQKDNNKKNSKKNGKKNGKSCPPCPPCTCNPCTPAFFSYCSPCHLECRCKKSEDTPIPQEPRAPRPLPGPAFPMPMPMPMPIPPPVVIVPFPPQMSPPQIENPRHSNSECDSRPVKSESCSEEQPATNSCESGRRPPKNKRKHRKNRGKKGKYEIYRRGFREINRDYNRDSNRYRNRDYSDDELVKPVLTYMSRNGDIKIRRRLSNDEANSLIGEGKSLENVQLVAGDDANARSRIAIMSQPEMRNTNKRKQIVMRNGMAQHVLGEGRKELVFMPPNNKKISNLSMSFQITR